MFTIKTIRAGTCADCHVSRPGVEFVLERNPGSNAFLCWKHFRMTLEAMRVASMVPENVDGAWRDLVDGVAEAP